MPQPLSQAVFEAAQRLDSIDPFIWLYELEVPTTPQTRYRFAGRYPEQVTFRGNIYYPFPCSHSETTENTDGDINQTSLTVGNISQQIVTTLETHGGFVGQPCRMLLVNRLDLASGNPVIEQDFTVRETAYNDEAVTLQLAVYNPYRTHFPSLRLMRGHCRFMYRGPGCGYSVPVSSGGLATCDKSYDGPNGCVVHGENEVAQGHTQSHPERFGGFQGIPRQITGGGI